MIFTNFPKKKLFNNQSDKQSNHLIQTKIINFKNYNYNLKL